ncbi:MAG: caspase family protein [Coleofasciculus sp. A1-SPW-01]|uniref:nSTAND1 domain-containing NTPase n=1 Tax=Coleofasciculus sp. A1-SPW-01 TaxID=3070819 RepID=UPI0032F9B7CF
MDREALVVGINLYPLLRDGRTKKSRHLDKPAADAEAVAQILETYGQFRVRRLPEMYDQDGNPHVAAKPHPTQLVRVKTLQEAIAQLFNPPSRQVPDTALLFFAGHGLRNDQGGVSEGFLATSDVKPQDGKWGVSLQWLRRLLQESPVRQQIVWLDCCHSGELLNFLEADPGAVGEARDRCFIAASRDFEVAYEEFGGQHGVLTGALLPGLRPEGKLQRWVTNYSLVEAINRQLLTSRQCPIFHNSGGEILLTGRKETIERAVSIAKVCPYKGLESFEFNDQDPNYFYGRTALTDQLLAKIRQGNFLAVVGASGSGKSSLVKAGLLYQLKLGQRLSGSDQWAIRIFRPGEHPLKSLALALVDEAAESGEVEQLASQGAAGLAELVGAIDAPRVVLVVDQFEEVFTLCQDDREREQFFECLLGVTSPLTPPLQGEGNMAAVDPFNHDHDVGAQGWYPNRGLNRRPNQPITSDQKLPDYQQGQDLESTSPLAPPLQGEGNIAPPSYPSGSLLQGEENIAPPSLAGKGAGGLGLRLNLTVVITMRADFFGKCAEQDYGGLANRIQENLVTITPMNTEELAAAITEPAKQVGLEIERELVTQMLQDVEGPGSLPLLQYTLTELWRQRQLNLLTLADYTKLGGVKGTLQKRADQVYESLSKEQQLIAKRIFLELTQLGEGTEDTRRQVFKQDFINNKLSQELVEQVITQLADARLLVTSQLQVRGEKEASLTVVDVAHEALIRHWTRLRQWLTEHREAMRIERKLEEAAKEWQDNGRHPDYLLKGAKLTEAKNYCQNYSDLGLLSSLAQEFIQKSIWQRLKNKWLISGSIVTVIGIVTIVAIVFTSLRLIAKKQLKITELHENTARVNALLPIQPVEAIVWAIKATGETLSSSSEVRQQVFPEVSVSLYDATRTVRELTILTGHQGKVQTVAYSPDGKQIVSGGEDGTLRLWNRQGQPIGQPWQGHQGYVTSVAFSPDSQQIVSGGADGTVKLWNRQGKPIGQPWKGHQSWVTSVAFSPYSQQIVSGDVNGILRLWDNQGTSIKLWRGHPKRVSAVEFSPDGTQIVSTSYDKTIRLWDSQGKPIGQPWKGHQGYVTSVAFSRNGEQIVSGGADETVRVWNRQGKPIGQPLIGHQGWVRSVAFSPNGEQIVSGGYDMTVRLWNRQGKPIGQPLIGHKALVLSVAFSPDGTEIASSSNDGTVRLWDSQSKPIGQPLIGHRGEVTSVAFSPNGEQIISGDENGTVRLWDSQGKAIGQPLIRHKALVFSVAVSPNGQQIVSGSGSGNHNQTIILWNRQGKRFIPQPLKGHQSNVYSVAFSRDGEKIVSGSDDGTIILWNKQGKPILPQPLKHQGGVRAVAFSPDGQQIASGGKNGTVRVWNNQGEPIGEYCQAHRERIFSLAFSPDSQRIVSGSADGTVRLCDNQGKLIQSFKPNRASVLSVAFSPNGIISGTSDGTVKRWNNQGTMVDLLLKESAGQISSVAFSSDEKRIVSGSSGGTISLWQSGSWETSLAMACETLKNHPILIAPETIFVEETTIKGEPIRFTQNVQGNPRSWVSFLNPTYTVDMHPIEVSQKAAEICMEYDVWDSKEKADFYVNKGRVMARDGKITEAINFYTKARKFYPDIDLNPQAKDNAPKSVAYIFAAQGKVNTGERLAREGQISEAINSYTQALELDPTLAISAYSWNQICWFGSLQQQATQVMDACEKAVTLAPENGVFRKSRGIARALTGDTVGAIEDFQIFIESIDNNEYKKQPQRWIDQLRAGKNPFTPDEFERLLNE